MNLSFIFLHFVMNCYEKYKKLVKQIIGKAHFVSLFQCHNLKNVGNKIQCLRSV